ncbi:hypothetical protein [Tautonia marina]|uniref:hypothetical protein n=1 Tax=Tautonia marina TaxID=2653855 RepID=UPI001375AD28|nr:hypothetical protein [Tautonia marina]
MPTGLVPQVEQWFDGALHAALNPPGPVRTESVPGTEYPRSCAKRIGRPMSDADLAAKRYVVAGGTPYGSEDWTQSTASTRGLESSLRPW